MRLNICPYNRTNLIWLRLYNRTRCSMLEENRNVEGRGVIEGEKPSGFSCSGVGLRGFESPLPHHSRTSRISSSGIIEYGFWMRKEGHSETTIERYVRLLKELAKYCACGPAYLITAFQIRLEAIGFFCMALGMTDRSPSSWGSSGCRADNTVAQPADSTAADMTPQALYRTRKAIDAADNTVAAADFTRRSVWLVPGRDSIQHTDRGLLEISKD